MNPLALYLASGESLYPGAVLLLLIIATSPFIRGRWWLRLRNLLVWIALALFLLACAPFSWTIYAFLLVLFLAWFVAWNIAAKPHSRRWNLFRRGSALALALLVLAMVVVEFPHRRVPALVGPRHDHLTVIGDSISSGIDAARPWPLVFQKTCSVPVVNLSRAGIGVEEALPLAKKLTPADTLVLLEIGGNDLIGDVPAADFNRGLERLLQATASPGRTVVMFELPLLPHKIAYGRIQRRLAERYGVYLIPKRFFIDVLSASDATSDGLHLSPEGARRMAATVAEIFSPVLHGPPRK